MQNMVGEDLLDSNQHKNKWCYFAETSVELYRYKLYSVLDNTSPHFAQYGKITIVYELIIVLCDIC